MICEACAFETERLHVDGWHSLSRDDDSLARAVATVLTERVTRSLPTSWQGGYTEERARDWIAERDAEGTTLLVVEQSTGQVVGFVILFETGAHSAPDGVGVEVRVGYLLSEPTWGQGYASELIGGLVGWCRGRTAIYSLTGGVGRDNAASVRVLQKNGFHPVEDGEMEHQEQLFRLVLRS